jgi:glycosyltransferase involved in cell wall biosynthesis
MSPEISIVICTHNRYDLIEPAIKSVEAQDLPPEKYELILVDNSTDLQAQASFLSEAELLCEMRIIVEKTPGLSRARNIGARAAKAPIVAFMDDDARASKAWASELVGVFKRNANAGIVGGPVRPIWSVPRPTWLHPWLEGFLTIVDRGDRERTLAPHEWLAGTNIAFLREPLIETGLFDEQLGRISKLLLSNEELSVTRKLQARGFVAVYNPKAEMHHTVHKERINQAWFRRRVFWQAISDLFDHDDEKPFCERLEKIFAYQDKLRPRDRGLVGMFEDIVDPDAFHAQTTAVTELVHLLAADARDWREYLSDEGR